MSRILRLERYLKITPDAFASIGVEVTPICVNKIGVRGPNRTDDVSYEQGYSLPLHNQQ